MRSIQLFISLTFILFHSFPIPIEKTKNTIPDTSVHEYQGSVQPIDKGKALFNKYCVMCHGSLGKGDGSAGIYLNPRPFDLNSEKVQTQSDSILLYKITYAKAPMPPFKNLSIDSRITLLKYIRDLARNNSAQTPKNEFKK